MELLALRAALNDAHEGSYVGSEGVLLVSYTALVAQSLCTSMQK